MKNKESGKFAKWLKENGPLALLFAALAVVVVGGVVYPIYACIEDTKAFLSDAKEVTVRTVNLKGVNHMSGVQGGFLLGCGRVSSVDYYVCYEELEDGGIVLAKFDSRKTVIYETLDADEQAYAEIEENDWGVQGIKLYVPEGTVQVDYDLSLS